MGSIPPLRLSERHQIFEELFEGRRGVRSRTFSGHATEQSSTRLFDVFLLELKRGSIKSRDQALSFIQDGLKNSLISDFGKTIDESTRPSYFLQNETLSQSTPKPVAKERRASWGEGQAKQSPTPRLIQSSELHIRPRFADLNSVVIDATAEASQRQEVNTQKAEPIPPLPVEARKEAIGATKLVKAKTQSKLRGDTQPKPQKRASVQLAGLQIKTHPKRGGEKGGVAPKAQMTVATPSEPQEEQKALVETLEGGVERGSEGGASQERAGRTALGLPAVLEEQAEVSTSPKAQLQRSSSTRANPTALKRQRSKKAPLPLSQPKSEATDKFNTPKTRKSLKGRKL